ncbi:hypothetical protein [Sinomonas soli]
MILDVNTLDLRQALQACLPHVSDPKLAPDLAVLHFVATDENLFVTGVNRASLGHAIVSVWDDRELTGDPDTDCFDLAPETAKELLTLFKSGGHGASEEGIGECLRIRVTDKDVTFLDVSGLFPGKTYTVPRQPAAEYQVGFARMLLECLIADAPAPSKIAAAGPVVKWFATAAQAYKQPLLLEPTDDEHRLLVTCGESFVGILMTLRTDDGAALADAAQWRDAWMHRLQPLRAHGTGRQREEAA